MRLLVLLVCMLASGCSTPNSFQQLIETQLHLYPELEIQDAYKFLHQAAMGNRHLGVDDSLIYNYLVEELNSIEAASDEPMVEFIAPDSSVVRLNLRPFKASGGSAEVLFSSMKATWDTVEPAPDLLARYGKSLAAMAGDTPFAVDDIERFFAEKAAENFPAVHHSERYLQHYAPAYRILLRQYLP